MKQTIQRMIRIFENDGNNYNITQQFLDDVKKLFNCINLEYLLLEEQLVYTTQSMTYFMFREIGENLTVTIDGAEAMFRILYAVYLTVWHKTHNEGEPVCYDEFVDNDLELLHEYFSDDELLKMHGFESEREATAEVLLSFYKRLSHLRKEMMIYHIKSQEFKNAYIEENELIKEIERLESGEEIDWSKIPYFTFIGGRGARKTEQMKTIITILRKLEEVFPKMMISQETFNALIVFVDLMIANQIETEEENENED